MWRAYTNSASSNIPSSRPSRRCTVLCDPRARRRAVPGRRAASWPTICGEPSYPPAKRWRPSPSLAPAESDRPCRIGRLPCRSGTTRNFETQLDPAADRHPDRRSRSAASSRSCRCSTSRARSRRSHGMRPYTPLELAGRNIYVREGCYLCHSQMIRPLRDEVERYGHYSLAAESMYDHPFQWGSKRNGPDLARVGGKYSDDWHRDHLHESARGGAGSIMPRLSVAVRHRSRLIAHRRRI